MKTTAIIPIKSYSQRVPGKNFRKFAGHPLYKYIISSSMRAECFDEIHVDTDSDEIKDYARQVGVKIINRRPELAKDTANGNDLLCYHAGVVSGDLIFQLFATAPMLEPPSIKACVDILKSKPEYDSVFTVTEEYGWFWFQGQPVNYRPNVLPRSQDAKPVIKETTGLYGIRRAALEKYRCRIGAFPYLHRISREEGMDLDTDFDFQQAQAMAVQKQLDKHIIDVKSSTI